MSSGLDAAVKSKCWCKRRRTAVKKVNVKLRVLSAMIITKSLKLLYIDQRQAKRDQAFKLASPNYFAIYK